MALVAPLVIAALIIAGVLGLVCKVKPWEMKEPITLPQSLVRSLIFGQSKKRKAVFMGLFNLFLFPSLQTLEPNKGPNYLRVPGPYPPSRVTLEPRQLPSVTSEQEDEEEEEEKHISTSDLDSSGSEGHGTDDDDYADRQADTRSTSVNSDEEISPYDCPHSHHLDLGDGDLVEGYGK